MRPLSLLVPILTIGISAADDSVPPRGLVVRIEVGSRIGDLRYSPEGKTVAVGVVKRTLLFDAATGKPVRELEGHEGGVSVVASC